MRDSPGAKMATTSQLSTSSVNRIVTKRRPLQGIIGGFCGALSALGSPGFGPRGGRGAAGGRASSAIALDRSRLPFAIAAVRILSGCETAIAAAVRPGGHQGARARSGAQLRAAAAAGRARVAAAA